MQDTDNKLTALAYALGWTSVIMLSWVTVGYMGYLWRLSGTSWPFPIGWFPTPEVFLIFIGVAKLIGVCLVMAWIAVLLYRRRLRALTNAK